MLRDRLDLVTRISPAYEEDDGTEPGRRPVGDGLRPAPPERRRGSSGSVRSRDGCRDLPDPLRERKFPGEKEARLPSSAIHPRIEDSCASSRLPRTVSARFGLETFTLESP
jgi:hypothetical protein